MYCEGREKAVSGVLLF